MLFSRASCLLVFTTSVAAAPFEKRFEGARRHWNIWGNSEDGESGSNLADTVESLVGGLGEHVARLVERFSGGHWDSRDDSTILSLSQLPIYARENLPLPSEGLTLYKVAVGRGTQNYTCDLSNSTAVPVAAGAVATLYDFTDSAACSTLGWWLSYYALNDASYPIANEESNPRFIGHHYFTDATTAYFNLDTSLHTFGQGGFGKTDSYDAPSNSTKGPTNEQDQSNGAVPWLKLETKDPAQCAFQEIYRVNTAGGQPPKTCEDYSKTSLYKQDTSSSGLSQFQIQYSAEYWFYATTAAE